MGFAEVNTFLLMHPKGIGQVRQKHFTKVLAKELLENPWIMAELLTDRQQALLMCPLIAAMGDLGGGSAHPLVAHKEVTSKSGEDMHVRKVKQQRFVMCGRKALAACEVCHKPSEGVVAHLYGPYAGRDCVARHMAGVSSRRRWRVPWGNVHRIGSARGTRRRRHSSID